MKRVLLIIGLAVILFFGWRQIANGPDEVETVSTRALERGNGAEPDSLDPQIARSAESGAIIRDLFEGLTRLSPDGRVIPGTAESWSGSDDGLTYTFKLRPEARWSNGDAVTAGDFVFGMRRLVDPETAAAFAFFLSPVVNANEIMAGEMPIDSLGVTALDAHTLEISLASPAAYLPGVLTHPVTFPVHRASLEQHGQTFARPGNLVSNGAYQLTEAVLGSHYTATRNPYYWDDVRTSIDQVVYHQIVDVNAELARFRSGDLDITDSVPPGQFAMVRETYPAELKVSPQLSTYFYGFNLKKPPFANQPGLRRALSMVVDRELLTENIVNMGQLPATGFVPPGVANYHSVTAEWEGWPMDQRIAEAQRLYAEAGYGPDKPLQIEIRYNTEEVHRNIAVAIASFWSDALGVETALLNEEFQVLLRNMREGNTEVYRSSWVGDYDDAYTFLEILQSNSGANFGGYSNSDYDDLLEQASVDVDMDRRRELMRDAEQLMINDQPIMPIYFYVTKRLVSQDLIGWQENSLNIHYTQDLAFAPGGSTE